MRIENLILMMLWCLIGIIQIINPAPFVIFLEIVMIMLLIYFLDKAHEGWGRTLSEWGKTIEILPMVKRKPKIKISRGHKKK